MPRRDLMLHQMQYDVVEQRRGKIVSFVGADAHSACLISQQRCIKQEQFPDRGGIAAKHSSDESCRRRITRGGDRFVVFTLCSVVALLHLILPSSVVIPSPPVQKRTPVCYNSCRRIQARSELSILLTRVAE